MRRMAMMVVGVPVLIALNLAACGSDDPSTFGNAQGDGTDGGGPGNGGGFSGSDGGGTDSGGGTLAQCATGQSGTTRLPVYLDIILDGSRSMDGHGDPDGPPAVPCDNHPAPTGSPDTCFLQGKRSPDPEAPGRTRNVCHDEGDDISKCPDYRGLTGKKWIAARGALKAYFAGQAQSPKLGLGMYLFSSTASGSVDIAAMSANQKDKLQAKIAPGVWPSKGTPLLEAFVGDSGRPGGEIARLRTFQPKAPLEANGKRVILLMTDGVPNPTDGTSGAQTQAKIKTAVGDAFKANPSIATFVVGIGDPGDSPLVYDEKFLSQLAAVGGAAPSGCTPDWDGANPGATKSCHYQVTPGQKTANVIQAEIKAAIDNVALAVQTCDLPLENVSAGLDPNKVNVLYTPTGKPEKQLPSGANGWTLDNGRTKVTLNGQSCIDLKSDPGAKVRVIIGCAKDTPVVN